MGIKSQIKKVSLFLDRKLNDVNFYWNIGGEILFAKTKIVNAIYVNFHHQFEADCLLGDVGEIH